MDLDLWDCLGRLKVVLQQNFIGLIYLFVVILESGKSRLLAEYIWYVPTRRRLELTCLTLFSFIAFSTFANICINLVSAYTSILARITGTFVNVCKKTSSYIVFCTHRNSKNWDIENNCHNYQKQNSLFSQCSNAFKRYRWLMTEMVNVNG